VRCGEEVVLITGIVAADSGASYELSDSLDMYPSHTNSTSTPIYEKIAATSAIQSSILAVTTAAVNDRQEVIRDSSVKGYIYVAEVDELKKKIKVLSPQPGGLPGNALVVGGWPEGVDDLV